MTGTPSGEGCHVRVLKGAHLAQISRLVWRPWQGLSQAWRQRVLPRLVRLDRAFPVTARFMIPIVVLGAASVAVVAWLGYTYERQRIEEEYVARGLILARALQADGIQGHFPEHLDDPADLQMHIERLVLLEPSLLRVNIYAQGEGGPQVVASSDPSLVGRPAEPHDALPLYAGTTITEETRLGDSKALEVLAPLQRDGKTVASLGVYLSLAERDAAIRALLLRVIAIPSVTWVAAMLLIWLILRLLVVSRLRKLMHAGQRLQAGDLSARVPGHWDAPGRDEIALVVQQFNQMAASLEELTRKLEQLAITDPLTGLYNRRHLDKELRAEVDRARRLGYSFALLILDLDGFKAVNDRFGHQMGDEVLKGVAAVLQANLRPMDIPARYGGDEFVVILPGADTEDVRAVGERLCQAVATTPLAPSLPALSMTLGVAIYPKEGESPDELLRRADEALLAAKQAGRNVIHMAGAGS